MKVARETSDTEGLVTLDSDSIEEYREFGSRGSELLRS